MRLIISQILWLCFLAMPIMAAETPEKLYLDNCSICHGNEGQGGVGIPLALDSFLRQAPNEYIQRTIRYGRPGRVMPSFDHLNTQQIQLITQHISSWRQSPAPVWDATSVEGQAAKGETLFNQHCVSCHHAKGEGGQGTGLKFSRPKELPISAPAIGNNGFLHSASDQMIKQVIMHGRKATPMPSAIKDLGLSEAQVNDVVAYLRSLQTPWVSAQQKLDEESPVLVYDSDYSLKETVANLERAAVGMNFRLIRKQALDYGFVKPAEESPHEEIVFFCNFNFLYEALKIDPRIGMFLPCRITAVENNGKVQVMSINPKRLSHFFNNRALDQACEQMHDTYTSIMEDATL